jgi:hypothetical protein
MTINSVFACLRQWNRKFLGARRPALSPQENFILASVSAVLPEADRSVLAEQLAALDLIQRSPCGRIVSIFLEPGEKLPLLSHTAPEHCLAQLRVAAEGNSVSVSALSHRGLISSIEYRGSPERLAHGTLSVLEATPSAGYLGAACALDRSEHARHA